MRESVAEFFLPPEGMKVGQGFFSLESLGVLWLMFDTGLGLAPLMGHLGCLASHWSLPVDLTDRLVPSAQEIPYRIYYYIVRPAEFYHSWNRNIVRNSPASWGALTR